MYFYEKQIHIIFDCNECPFHRVIVPEYDDEIIHICEKGVHEDLRTRCMFREEMNEELK